MLKAALLIRGPIRPDVHEVLRCSSDLIAQLRALPQAMTLDVYLATWTNSAMADIALLQESGLFANILLMESPSRDFIGDDIYERVLEHSALARNSFYQYFMAKPVLRMIASTKDYDAIVHSRTDMDINFGGHLPAWLNDLPVGQYRTLHTRESHAGAFINDQFAIARPETMCAAWDYGTEASLRHELLTVEKAEQPLQNNMDRHGVHAVQLPIGSAMLNSRRHIQAA